VCVCVCLCVCVLELSDTQANVTFGEAWLTCSAFSYHDVLEFCSSNIYNSHEILLAVEKNVSTVCTYININKLDFMALGFSRRRILRLCICLSFLQGCQHLIPKQVASNCGKIAELWAVKQLPWPVSGTIPEFAWIGYPEKFTCRIKLDQQYAIQRQHWICADSYYACNSIITNQGQVVL